MAKKKRVDTDLLFETMTGRVASNQEVENPESNSQPHEKPAAKATESQPEKRPAAQEVKKDNVKKIQISVYITKDQDRELSIQSALKEKGTDKSDIVRNALDIIFGISTEDYLAAKMIAESKGVEIGQVMGNALQAFLKGTL